VTECVLAELRALGPEHQPARDAAARVAVLKCRHAAHKNHAAGDGGAPATAAGGRAGLGAAHGADTEPGECLAQLVGAANEGRWVVATQDAELRSRLRAVPGAPLVLVSSNVLVLETPSAQTRSAATGVELGKSSLSAGEAAAVKAAKRALRRGIRVEGAPALGGGAPSAGSESDEEGVDEDGRAGAGAGASAGAGAGSGGKRPRPADAPASSRGEARSSRGGTAFVQWPRQPASIWSRTAVRSDRAPAPLRREVRPNPLSVKKRASKAALLAAAVPAPASFSEGGGPGKKRRRRGGGGGGSGAEAGGDV
jgi:rRNA-processing protein FCF1